MKINVNIKIGYENLFSAPALPPEEEANSHHDMHHSTPLAIYAAPTVK